MRRHAALLYSICSEARYSLYNQIFVFDFVHFAYKTFKNLDFKGKIKIIRNFVSEKRQFS